MTKQENTRREFLKATSAAVSVGALGCLGPAEARDADTSKILNYNPKMTYRRLGKTGFMISEIALGGHGAVGAGEKQVENRVGVLERAVELGMNYVDNNIAEECDLYGKAMLQSSGAKREKWFIGFGSWPQKVTEEYQDELTTAKMMQSIEDRLRSYHTDVLDMWRPVGATWGKGQNNIATLLMVTHKSLEMVVEVFEKARQQGKVRYLGISAHNPKVFHRVLEEYPQFSVIIFPYLFLTKDFGGDSLLKLAQEKDAGVIGLKPFGAGTVFGLKPQELKGSKVDVDQRAHVLIKEMLGEPRISAVIPGVNIPQHLDENVKGSYARNIPSGPSESKALGECRENFYANLTPEYQWLRKWEVV